MELKRDWNYAERELDPKGNPVDIIILVMSKLGFTKLCIESIQRNTKNYHLIIVDNNSDQETKDYLKTISGATIITNSANLGIPKGRNQGLRVSTSEYVVFIANDVMVSPKWLSRCVSILDQRPDVGVVGGMEVPSFAADQVPLTKDDVDLVRAWKNWWALREKWYGDQRYEFIKQCVLDVYGDFDKIADKVFNAFKDVYHNFAACSLMFFRRDIFKRVGLLDERYTPLAVEDADLNNRIKLDGTYRSVTTGIFYHHFMSITLRDNDVQRWQNENYIKMSQKYSNDNWKKEVEYLDK